MRLTYDPRYNIAYIRLQEKTAAAETIRISDELNVDLAPDGTVDGIELLIPSCGHTSKKKCSRRLQPALGGGTLCP
jgi:uncharacterized protein YuzE